jgi:hypothetical protein
MVANRSLQKYGNNLIQRRKRLMGIQLNADEQHAYIAHMRRYAKAR